MGKHADILDTPLLQLSRHDAFRLRDAVAGVISMGMVGGGKTTSAATLACAYLRAGMGGLVLCAKPEEVELWKGYCVATGRTGSLIVLDGQSAIINFLTYELARQRGAQGINSVIELLMRVLEMARSASASPGRQGDAFWEDTTRQIFRHAIPVLHAATGTVRIEDLLALVRSAPNSPEQIRDPDWQRQSKFYSLFLAAADRLDNAIGDRLMAYWSSDFATLDPKTRGNIVISLTTALDRFNHGWLREAFTTETYVPPELMFHGSVIVLAMPVLTLNEDGIIAQQLYKYLAQRAILARNSLSPEQRIRPVFVWADEAHCFLNSGDALFLSMCRQSLACTVYLTQSLPTLYAKFSHDGGHDRAHHFFGMFGSRLFHSNGCFLTNEIASRTLGKTLQSRSNFNESQGTNTSYGVNMGEGSSWNRDARENGVLGQVGGFGWSLEQPWGRNGSEGGSDNWGRNRGYGTSNSVTHGQSQVMEEILQAGEFGRMLKTGGPANGNRVTAIWYQAGRKFVASGGNSLLVEFIQ